MERFVQDAEAAAMRENAGDDKENAGDEDEDEDQDEESLGEIQYTSVFSSS